MTVNDGAKRPRTFGATTFVQPSEVAEARGRLVRDLLQMLARYDREAEGGETLYRIDFNQYDAPDGLVGVQSRAWLDKPPLHMGYEDASESATQRALHHALVRAFELLRYNDQTQAEWVLLQAIKAVS